MSDDFTACARIVERGDPFRFRTVMAAPPAVRDKLFALYAFNVEIARAPYVTAEPGIVEIRLQWWIDALEEIAAGGMVRKHEVVVPLAHILSADQARMLQGAVEARFRDAYSDPFADMAAVEGYLSATSGTLLEIAAQLLGQDDPAPARNAGLALGIANWFLAVPALKAHGKEPLPDESDAALANLAQRGGEALGRARVGIAKSARPAFLPMAGTRRILQMAGAKPARVLNGQLGAGPMRQSLSLMQAALLGRW